MGVHKLLSEQFTFGNATVTSFYFFVNKGEKGSLCAHKHVSLAYRCTLYRTVHTAGNLRFLPQIKAATLPSFLIYCNREAGTLVQTLSLSSRTSRQGGFTNT
jgi:hypothetical protein